MVNDEHETAQDQTAAESTTGDTENAREEGKDASMPTKTKKREKKPKAATKRVAKPKAEKEKKTFSGVPTKAHLRLGKNGVSAGVNDTLVLEFANGYSVSLKPVGVGDDVTKVRDLMVGWLRKRLGAERK